MTTSQAFKNEEDTVSGFKADHLLFDSSSAIDMPIQPKLKSLVIRFNHYIFESIHSSWLLEDQALLNSSKHTLTDQSIFYLSKWQFKKYQIDDQFDYDFEDRVKRIFLLAPPSLRQLIIIAGLTAYQANVCQILSGKELRFLRQIFGESLLSFTRNKAPFLMSSPFNYAQDNPSAADALKKPSRSTEEKLFDFIFTAGVRILSASLGSYPVFLKRRIMWKVDHRYKATFKVSFSLANDTDRSKKASKLLLKLTRELDDPCSQLFK